MPIPKKSAKSVKKGLNKFERFRNLRYSKIFHRRNPKSHSGFKFYTKILVKSVMHITIGAYDQCIYELDNNYKQLGNIRFAITVIGICSITIIILRAISATISVLVCFYGFNCLNRIILRKTLPTSTFRTQSNLFVKWQYCWKKRTRSCNSKVERETHKIRVTKYFLTTYLRGSYRRTRISFCGDTASFHLYFIHGKSKRGKTRFVFDD